MAYYWRFAHAIIFKNKQGFLTLVNGRMGVVVGSYVDRWPYGRLEFSLFKPCTGKNSRKVRSVYLKVFWTLSSQEGLFISMSTDKIFLKNYFLLVEIKKKATLRHTIQSSGCLSTLIKIWKIMNKSILRIVFSCLSDDRNFVFFPWVSITWLKITWLKNGIAYRWNRFYLPASISEWWPRV